MAWVSIDGEIMPGAEARISVFDRGFLFGDSVYEVLRTVRGRPLFWEEHAARLWKSAALIHLDIPVDAATLRGELEALLAAAGDGERYVRIVVTRGSGGLRMGPAEAPPCRVLITTPLPEGLEALRRDGCALHVFRTARTDEGGVSPQAKSGNKLLAVLAIDEARRHGADEALMVDPLGRVLEGSSSTFFLVRDGVLVTPPLEVGILEGITRAKVLELARAAGVRVEEATLTCDDIADAQEAFITSSVRGVIGVRAVGDRTMPQPGPVTTRIQAAYDAFLG